MRWLNARNRVDHIQIFRCILRVGIQRDILILRAAIARGQSLVEIFQDN